MKAKKKEETRENEDEITKKEGSQLPKTLSMPESKATIVESQLLTIALSHCFGLANPSPIPEYLKKKVRKKRERNKTKKEQKEQQEQEKEKRKCKGNRKTKSVKRKIEKICTIQCNEKHQLRFWRQKNDK